MASEKRLTVHVHDEGTDGFWAEIEQLPGCFATGDTLDELLASLREGIELYLGVSLIETEWVETAEERIETHKMLVSV